MATKSLEGHSLANVCSTMFSETMRKGDMNARFSIEGWRVWPSRCSFLWRKGARKARGSVGGRRSVLMSIRIWPWIWPSGCCFSRKGACDVRGWRIVFLSIGVWPWIWPSRCCFLLSCLVNQTGKVEIRLHISLSNCCCSKWCIKPTDPRVPHYGMPFTSIAFVVRR